MRLSFSTNAFTKHSVFDAVERIAATGYEGVELLADAPHLYGDSVTDADLDRLQSILDTTGIRVANINANTAMGYYPHRFWEPVFEPSLANPETELRHWRIAYTKKCIDMAHALGSPNVSVTSGRMVPGTSPAESLDLLKDSLHQLLVYAGERNVRIGIEYEPGLLIERYEELSGLIADMGSPLLGANLDLGHSHVLGEDHAEVLAGLGTHLFHIHIEDIKDRKHYHLIPGEGDMDFAAIGSTLERLAYAGFVTVELYTCPNEPEEAARRSYAYLRGIERR